MNSSNQKPSIRMILDARRYSDRVDTSEKVEAVWRQISPSLVGQPIHTGGSVSLDVQGGSIAFWIVDSDGTSQITNDSEFHIVDVLRSPRLLYQCAVCGEYGPLRCIKCEENGRETRLCSKHAHIIKDELSAYCSEHIPLCNCRDGCRENAVFRCRSCARTNRQYSLYGEHVHKVHPKEPDIDYCQRCYKRKFERCQSSGCTRPGRSKCHYQTRDKGEPCNRPSCTDHSFQWKIWGPHNRGVTLCELHQDSLSKTAPEDLIFLIVTSKAPFARRGRYQSMPNPFRLRRLINRHRSNPLTFNQLENSLKSIAPEVPSWGKNAERNYGYLMKFFTEALGDFDSLERQFLESVRSFYQNRVGWDASSQILGLQIQDRFSRPGEKPKYRVRLMISGEKGRLIGRGGAYMKDLRDTLNLEVDLD